MKETDWSGYFVALDHVEVHGDRIGTIVLNKPFAPFITVTLCHGPGAVLCEQAVKDAGGKFTTDFPAICGPYTYEAIPGQRATFRPNPEWTGPKPAFDVVHANVITEAKAAELAFDAGELDVTDIGTDTLARYRTQMPEGAAVSIAGELAYMWLGMNTEHPKLQDKRVRRAIQYAVDVDSILQGAYSNASSKSFGIVCPGLIGKRYETKYYQYDPAKARELLAEAGVSDLELTLKTLNAQERMLTATIIQANLAEVGIKVNIVPLDGGPFWEMGMESKGDQWKELEIWLMRYTTTPDPYEATQWFTSDQVGVWNWERWTSEEFDRLYDEGIAETDEAKRDDIYVRMQEIMEETGAYVWINHDPSAYVHRADLEISVAPSGEQDYRRFE
jgi:peptide/nickel transport system substrate-binding protein